MAFSSDSNSDLYKCPDDNCGKAFNNSRDFFDSQHWEKHKNMCPMAGCSSTSSKPSNFKSHWMKIPTHREYLGLEEEREVCGKCGKPYIKQYKGNHKRDCLKPKSNKRKRNEVDDEPATLKPMNNALQVSNKSSDDAPSVVHTGGEVMFGRNYCAKPPGDEVDLSTWQRQNVVSAATISMCDTSTSTQDMSLEPAAKSFEELPNPTHQTETVIDRYQLEREYYKPRSADPRMGFTFSRTVRIKRFALQKSTSLFRQWFRKVKVIGEIHSSDVLCLKVQDKCTDTDTPSIKRTRSIRMFVNDDHPAFVYCKQGRWRELDRILSTKEVTVTDVNAHGQTLLHVAAQNLRSDICQQLLSKGADVSARDFSERQQTAFGLVCRESFGTGEEHAFQISETLRILLAHGHDIVTSHEVDDDLYELFNDHYGHTDKVRQARLRTAVAVLYHYISSISCNGTLPIVDVHQHTQDCLLLYVIAYEDIVDTEDLTLNTIAKITPETLQAVFLGYIYCGREDVDPCPESLVMKLTHSIGDLHYQALFWLKDDHGDWISQTTSPLELASQRISSWFLLQKVINSARFSWPEFIEAELKLPDCKWSPNGLRALSEMSRLHFISLDIDWRFLDWLRVAELDDEGTALSRLVRWDKVVTDLKQNIPLNSVDYEIQQRIKQYHTFIAHSEDSESSDEDADTESSVDASP